MPDIQYPVVRAHPGGGAEMGVVAAQFGVVEVAVGKRVHGQRAKGPSRSTPRTWSSDTCSGTNSGSHQVAPALT